MMADFQLNLNAMALFALPQEEFPSSRRMIAKHIISLRQSVTCEIQSTLSGYFLQKIKDQSAEFHESSTTPKSVELAREVGSTLAACASLRPPRMPHPSTAHARCRQDARMKHAPTAITAWAGPAGSPKADTQAQLRYGKGF